MDTHTQQWTQARSAHTYLNDALGALALVIVITVFVYDVLL